MEKVICAQCGDEVEKDTAKRQMVGDEMFYLCELCEGLTDQLGRPDAIQTTIDWTR